MELTYNYNPHISHSTWIGNIAHSKEGLGENVEVFQPALITFSIDAIPGERVTIMNHKLEPLHGISHFDLWDMNEDELLELFPESNEEEIELTKSVAYDYAERHFNDGKATNVEMSFYSSEPMDFIYTPAPVLNFVAMNDQGRLVEIEIQQVTMELVSLSIPLEILAQISNYILPMK